MFLENLYISGGILNQHNIFKGQSGIKGDTKMFISFDPIIRLKKIKRMCITDFWTQRERERVGSFGRMAF